MGKLVHSPLADLTSGCQSAHQKYIQVWDILREIETFFYPHGAVGEKKRKEWKNKVTSWFKSEVDSSVSNKVNKELHIG